MTSDHPTDEDRRHLTRTIELAGQCPPSATAFSVGALVVAADGRVLATGHSREVHVHDHAEEVALAKLPPDEHTALAGSTLYSSLEPCSKRASRPVTCTQHIIGRGIGRVVFAWREPSLFVDCDGAEQLRAAGVEVIEIPELASAARAANAHLLDR